MRTSFYIGIAAAAVTLGRMHRRPQLQAAAGRRTGKASVRRSRYRNHKALRWRT